MENMYPVQLIQTANNTVDHPPEQADDFDWLAPDMFWRQGRMGVGIAL